MIERAPISLFFLLIVFGTIQPMHRTRSMACLIKKEEPVKQEEPEVEKYIPPKKNKFFEQQWPLTKQNIENKAEKIAAQIRKQIKNDAENKVIFSPMILFLKKIKTAAASSAYKAISIEELFEIILELEKKYSAL